MCLDFSWVDSLKYDLWSTNQFAFFCVFLSVFWHMAHGGWIGGSPINVPKILSYLRPMLYSDNQAKEATLFETRVHRGVNWDHSNFYQTAINTSLSYAIVGLIILLCAVSDPCKLLGTQSIMQWLLVAT